MQGVAKNFIKGLSPGGPSGGPQLLLAIYYHPKTQAVCGHEFVF